MKNVPDNELLSAYLDGEVTPQQRAEVEQLLEGDPAVRALLDELRALGESIRNLPAAHLAEDLSDRVLQLAERQILLQRPEAGLPHALPTPSGVARSVARRFLQPRAIAWTAIILLVAAGLYWFGPRERAKPLRQVAGGPPIALERTPAETPALRAGPAEKQPAGQSSVRQEGSRVERDERVGNAMPAAGGLDSAKAAMPAAPPAVAFGGRVKDKDFASHARPAAEPGSGPVSMSAGGVVVLRGANNDRWSPYQDVKVITISVTSQAQERNALERLLVQQQITFRPTLPGSQSPESQYVGDAGCEQFASLLKALRSRTADFPSVVEQSPAANAVLWEGTGHNRPADEPVRGGQDLHDALPQQPQNAQPVLPQRSLPPLRDSQAAAGKKGPEIARVRFLLQVTEAAPSASSLPAAASAQSKPAARSNPLRRAAGPNSSSDRPQ